MGVSPRFFQSGLTPKNRGADATPLRGLITDRARSLVEDKHPDLREGTQSGCFFGMAVLERNERARRLDRAGDAGCTDGAAVPASVRVSPSANHIVTSKSPHPFATDASFATDGLPDARIEYGARRKVGREEPTRIESFLIAKVLVDGTKRQRSAARHDRRREV